MKMIMQSEKLLIKQIQSGDNIAFRRMVELHHLRVIHICLSFVHSPQDAEDISQEVFIEVYKSINTYRFDASLSTWLYRLAVNKSLDFLRQKKRKKRGFGLVNSVDRNELESINYGNDDVGIEEKERILLLRSAIEKLPERQRVAITLSKIDELGQKEVAELMQTTVASVEALLIRAKKKLHQLLIKHKQEIF
ncbi:RNA polymerase sigma factor [Carboxylicivirga sp. N1Y90]|uniref:RNA polymerase sigma factor n=1 Tax=Carboxylicivirga fragile TaxID=3417571 RepID=UPI003D334F32|nr:RNA polymerase sigma factor [Marinilabiliaceae bacterium N1Y90]